MDTANTVHPDDLVSVRDAADRTGIPIRTLYNWIENDKLLAYSIGGHLLIHRHTVNALMDRKRDG